MPTPFRLAIALICIALPAGAGAWEVGIAPATRKILPDTPMPTARTAVIEAARNEWEAFQIVIRAAAGAAGVAVSLSDLCAGGVCVAASAARLYREWYVEVTRGSPVAVAYHERDPGWYPDPLIPFTDPYAEGRVPAGAPFDLGAAETGVVFVDWYVPLDTPPGSYRGVATVSAGGGQRTEIPIALTVWELEIPRERGVATAFRYCSDSSVRKFHGGPVDPPSEEFATIVHRYERTIHEHRIDPTTLPGADVSFAFDESIGSPTLVPVDWAAFDAAVAPWLDGSRFGDGVPVARWNVNYFRPGQGLHGLGDAKARLAARAFAEHLQAAGWWDKAWVYGKDEPWLSNQAQNTAAIVRDTDILFQASDLWRGKTLITGPYVAALEDKVGIWCPYPIHFDAWFSARAPKAGREKYAQLRQQGVELWFYTANGTLPPYPGYDIDTRIGYEPRILKWGAFYEGATGFLYWRTCRWFGDDPWNTLYDPTAPQESRNGDGTLLYPGDRNGTAVPLGAPGGLAIDGPIPSYRLKQIRDGLEDWELFIQATALGGESFVRTQIERAYRRFGVFFVENCADPLLYCRDRQPWTLDEEVLLDARRQVARKLLFLKDPGRYADPEAGDPGGSDPEAVEVRAGCAVGASRPRGPHGYLLLGPLLLFWRRRSRARACDASNLPTGRRRARSGTQRQ